MKDQYKFKVILIYQMHIPWDPFKHIEKDFSLQKYISNNEFHFKLN